MDNNNSETFFEFVRYCIDEKLTIPNSIHNMDWESLFLFMQQQALLGVGFSGIARLKKEGVEIPRPIFLQWFALSERIKQQNGLLNERVVEVVRLLKKEGIRCCILKGQGNNVMYPDPYLRTSGDIDVWTDRGRQCLMELVRKSFPTAPLRYHHVDYPVFKDVMVEVHFMPSTMNNPIYNRRLNSWFDKNKEQQLGNFIMLPNKESIPVPTAEFNIIYQMSHLMHHFFDEGIGLRQMMDYYFVLQVANSIPDLNKESLVKDLKYMGLYKFAGAVMYVMQQVFGMEEARLIVPVDEKRGRTLMEEILKGGNFGKHSGLTNHTIGVKHFLKIQRNLRFVREYPAEALCEPVFRTWHFFWRLCH